MSEERQSLTTRGIAATMKYYSSLGLQRNDKKENNQELPATNRDEDGGVDTIKNRNSRPSDDDETTEENITDTTSASSAENQLILSVDDAIERIGYGRFQLTVLLAAGLCFAADSMEVLLLSFLTIILQVDWNLSEDKAALITSSVFAGALIGTLVLGNLADKFGRRPIFCLAASIISLFGMATAVTTTFASLLTVRFIVGFGVGGLTVPFDTLAEFLPNTNRGRNLLYIEYFWAFGTLSVPIIAYITLGMYRSWQLFVFVCAIPCLIAAILGTYFVPESPRWLCAMGKDERALSVLRHAAKRNGHDDPLLLFPPETKLVAEDDEHESICDLFQPKFRKLTLLMWGVWFGYAFGYYGSVLTITQVFADDIDEEGVNEGTTAYDDNNDIINNPNDTKETSTYNDDDPYNIDYYAILSAASGEILGVTLVVLTIDRLGRKPSQTIPFCLAGVCLFFLAFVASTSFAANDNTASTVVLVIIGFLIRAFEMAGGCVTWVACAELLPTEIRASGHSAANAVARLGGFSAPFLIKESTSIMTIGTVMLILHTLIVIFVTQLPETAGIPLGETMMHHPHHEYEHGNEGNEDYGKNGTIDDDKDKTKTTFTSSSTSSSNRNDNELDFVYT